MSAEQEMRNVILHAAEKLRAVIGKDIEVGSYNNGYALPTDASTAMAYAEGVLRLLASYLAVEDAPRLNGQAEPQREGGRVRAATGERDEHGRFVKASAAGTGTEGAG